ncbi:MAG: hypothetical protein ACQETQ_11900 [Spirochaetota bacterium]
MSNVPRGDILHLHLHLRLRYAARLATEGALVTAVEVRKVARELFSVAAHVAVITWAAPPTPRAALSYLVGALAAREPRKAREPRSTQAKPHAPAGGEAVELGGKWAPLLPRAGEVRLLHDERVAALQRRIVSVVFLRRFGLSVGESQLETLGAYSSVAWLSRNLANAAGYGARPPAGPEARRRLQVVLPVLTHVLDVHRRYLALGEDERHPRRHPRGRSRAATRGVITSDYYPHEVSAEALCHKMTAVQKRATVRRLRIRAQEETRRLDRQLEAVTLLYSGDDSENGPRRPRSTRRAARALSTMRRIEI